MDAASFDGATPLVIAAEFGNVACVRALIRGGAEVNRAKDDGTTAVAIATNGGHAECVRALRAAGANMDMRSYEQAAVDESTDGANTAACAVDLDR